MFLIVAGTRFRDKEFELKRVADADEPEDKVRSVDDAESPTQL